MVEGERIEPKTLMHGQCQATVKLMFITVKLKLTQPYSFTSGITPLKKKFSVASFCEILYEIVRDITQKIGKE